MKFPRLLLAGALLAVPVLGESVAPVDETSRLISAPFAVDGSHLARHHIVYKAPMQLETEGFPLGNGDMGGLVWTHD